MQITRETDYAIRCVQYLCKNPSDIKMVDEIASEMKIPKSFLAKILQKLTKAKIAKSFRGVKGGFILARRPEDINLLEIIEVIEGPIAMNICAVNERYCSFSDSCSVHPIWVSIKKDIEQKLRSVNFKELISVGQ